MKTIEQISIRRQNVQRIWEILCKSPHCTRQELAEGAGLSLMSVSNLVDQLDRLDVLSIIPAPTKDRVDGRRIPGRRADIISLCKTRHAWLIFNLADRYFHMTALSLDLSPLMSYSAFSGDSQDDYLPYLKTFLADMRVQIQNTLGERTVLGVAIVTPGPYNVARDTVNNQRIPSLNAIQIKALFREVFGGYDYYVDEDVKFAVRSHMPLCSKEDLEILFYLYIGEGVGGASIHNENVLRGMNAVAGDAGQLRTHGNTYESLLSLRVFAKNCGLEHHAEINEEALLASIAQFAKRDGDAYRRAVLESAKTIGQLLHTVVWMLDPAIIVVDCRYASLMNDEFLRQVDASLALQLAHAQLTRPQIVSAGNGMHSITYGAAQVLSKEWIIRMI